MWSAAIASSLGRRIVASVAVGLALVLVVFSMVAVWSIRAATESAYIERVALAQALVWHVDDILGYTLATLDSEAGALTAEHGGSIRDAEAQTLTALRKQIGNLESVSVVDASGVVVWTDPIRPEQLGHPPEEPGAAAALATGESQVTQVLVPGVERALANLAVPARDAAGHTVGVLTTDFDPGLPGLNVLPTRPVGDAMQVHLINSDGLVLAGSIQGDRDRQMDKLHAVLLADLIQRHVPGYRIHNPPPVTAADGIVSETSSHIVAYAPLAILPAWGVVVEQPEDVVLAAPHQLETRLGLAGIALLVLAGAVAWLDVRRVIDPLQHLTRAARRFAEGDLDQPITLERADELGVLAGTFETMRRRLSASLAEVSEWNRELERRVAARTAEVERRNRELSTLNAVVRAPREHERAELIQRIIAGQEEERRRLAQELHDQTSQALASLQLGLDRLAGGAECQCETRRIASELRAVAAQTLDAVHHLAVELRPSVLDDVGLVAALQRYLRELADNGQVQSDFVQVGVEGLRLVPAAETAVYRIVQAALTNIIQHANARHVSVILQIRGGNLVAVVEDDGQGFDVATVRSRSLEQRLGLAGMEERAELIGATLTVESSQGTGTSVFLEVPLELNVLKVEVDGIAAPGAG